MSPLSNYSNVIRRCPSCTSAMPLVRLQGGAPAHIPFLNEQSYQFFCCPQCGKEVTLPTTGLLAAQFTTSMLTILTCALIFWNNNLLPLWGSLFETPLAALIGISMTLIAVLLTVGGIWNGFTFIRNLRLLSQAPLQDSSGVFSGLLRIVGTFLYSLLPWLYWFGVGFLNDTYLHIDRDWGVLLVLPGFIPIFIAGRFGIAPTLLFLLTASYPTAAFIYMWFF